MKLVYSIILGALLLFACGPTEDVGDPVDTGTASFQINGETMTVSSVHLKLDESFDAMQHDGTYYTLSIDLTPNSPASSPEELYFDKLTMTPGKHLVGLTRFVNGLQVGAALIRMSGIISYPAYQHFDTDADSWIEIVNFDEDSQTLTATFQLSLVDTNSTDSSEADTLRFTMGEITAILED